MNSPLSPDNRLIESYILGKLSEADERKFLVRLEDDREFARKFRLIKNFPEMMSDEGRQELEALLLQSLTEEKHSPDHHYSKKKMITWSVAGLVLILISVSVFIFTRRSPDQQVVIKPAEKLKTSRDVSAKKPASAPKQVTPVASKDIDVQDNTGLILPENGSELQRTGFIRFQWAMKIDTFSKFFVVSKSTGNIALWRGIRPGQQSIDIEAGKLYPGVYSWFLGTNSHQSSFSIK